MKNQVTIAAVLLIAIFLIIAASGMAQDKKEKKVTVKRVEVEDGKKVVKDTTFTLKEGEELNDIVSEIEWVVEADSMRITSDVFVDVDSDEKTVKKIIVMKGKDGEEEVVEEIIVKPGHRGGKKKVMVYKSDDGEDVVMVMPSKHKKAMVWHSDDDYEFEFDVDEDFEFDAKAFEAEMKAHMKEMEDARVIILDEKMELLDELDELKDIEIEIRKPRPPKHAYFEKHHLSRFDHGVTDKELRDAGVKNKPDRLEVEELDLDINEGVVTLGFTMKGDANPKVEVYNFFGDQVFTGKPQALSGKYTLVMDLSRKQHGIYYIQIIEKNSSLTEKIRL